MEPDLKPINLSSAYINEVCSSIGELPDEKRERYRKDYELSEFDVHLLTSDASIAMWFEKAVMVSKYPKKVANWILTNILSILNEKKISINELKIKPEHISQLVSLIEDAKITSKQGKGVFAQMIERGEAPESIAKEARMELLDDEGVIKKLIEEVFSQNMEAIGEYKKGKTNVLPWLVGQVIKASNAKANPKMVYNLVNQKLKE